MMSSLSIMEIERFAIHDGPGIRSVVFLQGCPLHCPWCSNPESQKIKRQLMHLKNRCAGCGRCMAACPEGCIAFAGGYPVFDREQCPTDCTVCGDACPENAIKYVGTWKPVPEIMQVLLRDRAYYEHSGGGVTVSGGEPFVQSDGLMALLQACKAEGLHTAIETCGQVDLKKLQAAYPFVDLFLFDVKHTNPQVLKDVTGADYDIVLRNLRYLAGQDPRRVIIRVPVVPGFNQEGDVISSIQELASQLRIENVELLPYHMLGKDKYEQLGRTFDGPTRTTPTTLPGGGR